MVTEGYRCFRYVNFRGSRERGSERATGSVPLDSKKTRGLLSRSRTSRFLGVSYSSLAIQGADVRNDRQKGSSFMTLLQKIGMIVVFGATVLLTGTFMAWAHGGDATLVHACINNSTRIVRILSPNDNCQSHETAQHWSIQGPAGPVGPQGPQWVSGAPGALGTPGAPGATVCLMHC